MSWQDITRRVLPPVGAISPHTTSAYGIPRTTGTSPHRGVDFNYNVGPNGQQGINLTHPALRSPVAGVVTNAGEGDVGRIAIRDANGFSHEILHTDTRLVKRGDLVGAGQPIGTMGNTGTKDQHVHYQLKDPAGQVINPTEFWDRLGPAKADPGQPAYIGEYQQYLQGPGADAANGFGNVPDAAIVPSVRSLVAPSQEAGAPYASENVRRLSRSIAGQSMPSPFDAGTPAVPSIPPNQVLSPVRPDSFVDRFGNRTSADDGARNASPPMPTPQATRPLGIVSGQPMPDYPFPPSIFGPPDRSMARGEDGEDWLARWLGSVGTY